MDATRFDGLARRLGTRRTTLGGLFGVVAALAGLDADAKKKTRNGGNAEAKKKHDRGNAGTRKKQDGVNADGKPKKKKKKKCKGGTITCGKTCVTAATDAQNCGGCGVRCGSGVACVGGRCASSCPATQIRCGDLCVDAQSNEQHCGGCGRACTGDLTCLNGACGCADGSETQCGDQCANLQSDDAHCGACNQLCTADQRCQGGQCVARGCAAGELDCGGGVCAGGANPCCSPLDCGGGNGELVCDTTTHQCVCDRAGEGICKRFSNGAGLCDVCCGNGSHVCIDDTICIDSSTTPGISFCDCPAGQTRCAGSQNAHKCQASRNEDNRRCGINCEDCTRFGPTSFCCNGLCLVACEPNTTCNLRVCDGCRICTGNTACCRSGSTNLFGCAELVNGECPGPAAG